MYKYTIEFSNGSAKEFEGECWAYTKSWRLYLLKDKSFLLIRVGNVNYIHRKDQEEKGKD